MQRANSSSSRSVLSRRMSLGCKLKFKVSHGRRRFAGEAEPNKRPSLQLPLGELMAGQTARGWCSPAWVPSNFVPHAPRPQKRTRVRLPSTPVSVRLLQYKLSSSRPAAPRSHSPAQAGRQTRRQKGQQVFQVRRRLG